MAALRERRNAVVEYYLMPASIFRRRRQHVISTHRPKRRRGVMNIGLIRRCHALAVVNDIYAERNELSFSRRADAAATLRRGH